jgi:hypothetical protein
MPASTQITIATCVQIQNGDMNGTIDARGAMHGLRCARIATAWSRTPTPTS